MPSYISVVMDVYERDSGSYIKLLLPFLETESVVFDKKRYWVWLPTEGDARDMNVPRSEREKEEHSFRRLTGLIHKNARALAYDIIDFREG